MPLSTSSKSIKLTGKFAEIGLMCPKLSAKVAILRKIGILAESE
jgi:hypothetical protein